MERFIDSPKISDLHIWQPADMNRNNFSLFDKKFSLHSKFGKIDGKMHGNWLEVITIVFF